MGLSFEVCADVDHAVLRLEGALTLETSSRLFETLVKLLADPGRVLVELSALRCDDVSALEVFPAALTLCGGWPDARLVLAGAAAELAGTLRVLQIGRVVPTADTLDTAAARLDMRPERVSRRWDLPDTPVAARLARCGVRSACVDWGIDEEMCEDAAMIATELVSNAVDHARTPSRLTLSLDPARLEISVRDYFPCPAPRPRPVDVRVARGRGLHVVAMLSERSGGTDHEDGKSVWAVLAVPHPAT